MKTYTCIYYGDVIIVPNSYCFQAAIVDTELQSFIPHGKKLANNYPLCCGCLGCTGFECLLEHFPFHWFLLRHRKIDFRIKKKVLRGFMKLSRFVTVICSRRASHIVTSVIILMLIWGSHSEFILRSCICINRNTFWSMSYSFTAS